MYHWAPGLQLPGKTSRALALTPPLARHVYIEGPMTLSDITAQLLAVLESSMEDTRIPDAIAEYASKRAGKPVTKTDAIQLEAALRRPPTGPASQSGGTSRAAW